jgi:C1A family cysteine protease
LKNLLSFNYTKTNAFYSSRLFIYCNAREWDGTDLSEDVGCTNLSACLSISKYKACEEEYWPYIESKYDEKPPQSVYERASTFRKFHYSIVDKNVSSIKSALASSHPVMFGLVVYPSFVNCGLEGNNGRWRGPNARETPIGGHSLLLVGYNDETSMFTFINHWGREWGSDGYGELPYSLFEDDRYVGDLCAVEMFA